MNDKASRITKEAFSKVELSLISGTQTGPLLLTPPTVKQTKGPRFWEAHARFRTNPEEGAHVFHRDVWKDKYGGKETPLHIYDGGLKFPESCPVCLKPATHHEVVEATIFRRGMGRSALTNVSQEKANRIYTALRCDRFWYVISFSDNHGIDDRAAHFNTGSLGGLTLILKNREYAQRFAELNNLKGKYIRAKHIIMQLMGYVGMTLFGAIVCAAGFMLYQGLTKGEWQSQGGREIWSRSFIALSIISLIGLIVSVYLALKGNKGEPIIVSSD